MTKAVLIFGLLVLIEFCLSGCSTQVLMKDCKPAGDTGYSICKRQSDVWAR